MIEVSVDDDFARFGSKSYAINKITSVEVRERRPHEAGCAIALFIIGGLIAIAVLHSLSIGETPSVGLLITVGIIAAAGYWQWERAKIVEYQLFLITSAAETQAFVSNDRDEVMSLRDQVEGAMARTSRR